MNSAVKAIEKGFQQSEIQQSAFDWQREIETDKRVIVGVNKFQLAHEGEPKGILRVDEAAERSQIEKLRKWRKERNNKICQSTLAEIRKTSETRGEMFEKIIDAVKAGATLGEITSQMKSVFGEYRESVVL
jgi:methylmalonyl-CoA mutase N-terminal domain/subunit